MDNESFRILVENYLKKINQKSDFQEKIENKLKQYFSQKQRKVFLLVFLYKD